MQPVATINGVKVFSNKPMSGIANSRIMFLDGSYADVRTGEVVNNGSGYISIGAAPSGTGSVEPITVGPKSFTASQVSVSGLNGSLEIQPGQSRDVEIKLVGPESAVHDVLLEQRGNTVHVSSKGSSSSSGGDISISGGSISIVGMSFGGSISGDSDESELKVSICVPKGTSLEVQGVSGKTNIGDVEGPLDLSMRGSGKSFIGKMGNTILSTQGSGDIRAAEVNGDLSINIQGSGDIDVKGGMVNMLTARIMGSGDIDFGGKAVNANLSVMGSGDIEVSFVENKPKVSKMGSGDIEVGNW